MAEEKLEWEVTSPESRIAGESLIYTAGVVLFILICRFITALRKLYFSNPRIAPGHPIRRSSSNNTASPSSQQLGFVLRLYFVFLIKHNKYFSFKKKKSIINILILFRYLIRDVQFATWFHVIEEISVRVLENDYELHTCLHLILEPGHDAQYIHFLL